MPPSGIRPSNKIANWFSAPLQFGIGIYSHTTWEAMCRAVESLEYKPSEIVVFGAG